MNSRILPTRRNLLGLGIGTLAASVTRVGGAVAGSRPIRIGVVLPDRSGPAITDGSSEAVAAEMARKGALMGGEEYGLNASMVGYQLDVVFSSAPSPKAAFRAGQRLVAQEDVCALVGGYDRQAEVLQDVASRDHVLFLNIGSSSDALRGEKCRRNTFHVEASAAMYIDACTEFFIRSGLPNWFLVSADTDHGRALATRARKALVGQHWKGRETGHAIIDPLRADFSEVLREIGNTRSDLVVLLLPWLAQLDFLAQYEVRGLKPMVTGFSDPVTQTREFLATARERSPIFGSARRVVPWEATLASYGARELNERFYRRWGVPMDGPAWAAYQAVKILFEAAVRTDSLNSDHLIGHLENPATVFDVAKGIEVSFRPWDHQLRQPLYVIKVDADAERARDLAHIDEELPANYRSGTGPAERLDQLGDLHQDFVCR